MAAIEKFLKNFIVQRPALLRALQPAASWYVNASGYRKLGLRFDDLLSEECEVGNMAMKRLSPAQTYERVFRLRRAMQYSLMQKILPENEWTTDEEDVPYLSPIIEQIEAELKEEQDLNSLTLKKK